VRGYRRWQIEHQCPQCGGPVTLDETDRLFTCQYCRVRLYFLGGRYFRYIIPPAEGASEEIFYIPYWRFKGMYYSCPPFEVKSKVLDASFLASGHDFFAKSLGIKTQALKLKFVSPEVEGRFFKTRVPFDKIISRVEKISGVMDSMADINKVFHRSFIGEAVSMIYFPVYVKGRAIYDALLNRPMAKFTKIRADEFKSIDRRGNWQVNFLSALCPNCGWDLSGKNDSVVLLCPNCDSAWGVRKSGFSRVDFGFVSSRDAVLHIPFWRMKVKVEGVQLKSYADLVRTANLPKVVKPQWEEKELYFWLPAFKVNPRTFMKLGKLLTLFQPETDLGTRLSNADYSPVTLGAREAAQGLKALFAGISSAKRKVFPHLPEMNISLKQASLVFLPFKQIGNDFVETSMNFRISKNALSR
jgi:DNA-directed RNA polymerase subunit RPC12/RpoP